MSELILASTSPWRRMLLEKLGLPLNVPRLTLTKRRCRKNPRVSLSPDWHRLKRKVWPPAIPITLL